MLRRCLVLMAALVFLGSGVASARADLWYVVNLSGQRPTVVHGVQALEQALTSRGVDVVLSKKPPKGAPTVWVVCSGDGEVGQTRTFQNVKAPTRPESYVIRVSKQQVLVLGSDPVGTMYGCFDVAEQIRWMQEKPALRRLRARTAEPFLDVRAVNPFLHVQALLDTTSWYFSDAFWTSYLDLLAESRHNLLDIHAAYDLRKTDFPNIFPYFFSFKEFPQTGVPPELTQRIFAQFKHIVALAKERGIHVALMNYNTGVSSAGKALTGERLVQYTQRSVRRLLSEVPDLWAFGFRIGESGQSEGFFERAYLSVIREVAPNIRVYTRTWGADPKRLAEVGREFPGHFVVEPKYNGEQMGLPYQGIVEPIEPNLPPAYSYEVYPVEPQPWRILWQVRTNGTHRIFAWGDPDFVRRTALSCRLGRGLGYTVEPLSAYYPVDDAYHRQDAPDGRWYHWNHERTWFWYELWGRLGYDPNTPESVWIRLFHEHYGAAGKAAYQALRQASKIVPLIFAYHRLGPDHRQMAPELETGNDVFALAGRRVAGTLEDFVHCPPLDTRTFASISEYVRAWMGNPHNDPLLRLDVHAGGDSPAVPKRDWLPTGKVGPYEVVRALRLAAKAAEKAARSIEVAGPPPAPPLLCLLQDVHALVWLGRYYVWKIQAATHYAFYLETGDLEPILRAYGEIDSARTCWANLAAVADRHYGPFADWLRMKTDAFTWLGEGKKLERDVYDLDRALADARKHRPLYGGKPVVGHVPVRAAKAGQDLRVAVYVYAREAVHAWLYYRLPDQGEVKALRMLPSTEFPRVYEATIPGAGLTPGQLHYLIRVETHGPKMEAPELLERHWYGSWIRFDSVGARVYRPDGDGKLWYAVNVVAKDTPPQIELLPSKVTWLDKDRFRLTLRVRIHDAAGIRWAKLYFKPLPSHLPWHEIPLAAEAGGAWNGQFVVDHRGALFYVEAATLDGRATQYPDVRFETPYLRVPSWDPARAAEFAGTCKKQIETGRFWPWDPNRPGDYDRPLWRFW